MVSVHATHTDCEDVPQSPNQLAFSEEQAMEDATDPFISGEDPPHCHH